MAFKESLYELLKDDAGVKALAGARVYPSGSVPQTAGLPRLTFQQISRERPYQTGTSPGATGTDFVTIQVDSWGDGTAVGHKEAEDLAEAVITAMEAAANTTVGTTNTTNVDGVFLDAERELPENPRDGSSAGINRISQDWKIAVRS